MAATKKKTGLKKKYIKLAGKGGFKKAWSLQKAAGRKAKTARKKTTGKKTARKKVVKKVVRKTAIRRKPVKKTVRKKVARKKTTIKRKGPIMAKKIKGTRRKRRNNPKMNIQRTLMDGALAAAGAIGASAIANMIPVPDPRIKAAIPIVAAMVLPMTGIVKGDMAKALSMGMLTVGALSLVRQFIPNVPLLAGEDENMLDYMPDDDLAMLGMDDDLDDELMLGDDLDDELMLGGESIDIAGESVDVAGDDFVTMDDVV
jgi:hypothetical protein